ncbi:hypothetical protein M9H77_13471 [Catharanthus roseus]|uniref:Uncharacterized protein n=1 Tax=Catharanthus roseus TaxID=4058 RepID=A0ACC0BKI7_CATRO|nr:hypothetical protein M9H77_13471 [Catharanthus roseus]
MTENGKKKDRRTEKKKKRKGEKRKKRKGEKRRKLAATRFELALPSKYEWGNGQARLSKRNLESEKLERRLLLDGEEEEEEEEERGRRRKKGAVRCGGGAASMIRASLQTQARIDTGHSTRSALRCPGSVAWFYVIGECDGYGTERLVGKEEVEGMGVQIWFISYFLFVK